MRIQLPDRLIDRLLSMPESGMGFQVVDFVLSDGTVIGGVTVLNAEAAELPPGFDPDRIAEVRLSHH